MLLYSSPLFISSEDELAVPGFMGNIQVEEYEEIVKMFKGGDTSPFTNLDLFSLDGMSEKTIREKLFKELKLRDTKNSQEKALHKLNTIYTKSIIYMEDVLYRVIPIGMKQKKWTSMEEFLASVENHLKRSANGYYSLMFCVVLKIMLVEAGLHENPRVDELNDDMKALLQKIGKIPGLKIKKPETGIAMDYMDYVEYELDNTYILTLSGRAKTKKSILIKLICNRGYSQLSDFKDLLAVKFELDPSGGEPGYVHTIIKIRNELYGKNKEVKFEIKGGILDDLSIGSLRKANIAVIIKSVKGGTSLQYEDAKFIEGEVDVSQPKNPNRILKPEIQFVLPDNKNESGFSDHMVYDLKKILSANARLFGALTIGNIQYILEKYKTRFDSRALLNHLLYPQGPGKMPFLLIIKTKSKRTGKDRIYFTTNDIYYADKKHNLSDIYNFPRPINLEGSASAENQKIIHDAVSTIMRTKNRNLLKDNPPK